VPNRPADETTPATNPLPAATSDAPVDDPKGALNCDHGLRRQTVVELLLVEISRGRFRPEQRLVTQQLATAFGVSPTPVREALVELARMGVVELSPNRGAVVRRVGPREIREICQVRRVLECEAVRLAVGRVDLKQMAALELELRGLLVVPSPADAVYFAQARATDDSLHDLVAASCGNAFLAAELGRLKTLFRAYRDLSWAHEEERNDDHRIPAEAAEHLAVIEALRSGDPRRAVHAMSRHIRMAVRYWARAVATNDPTPPPAPPFTVDKDGDKSNGKTGSKDNLRGRKRS
ncbi:MAG: GntR family transcriptional regulator, partial [Planctomycetia bacterium]